MIDSGTRPTATRVLVLSQTFPPDPAAGGQLLADACVALAERGNVVRVLTPDRGYDDPTARYPGVQTYSGVTVRRLPFCSFGKGSLARRLLGALSFTWQALARGVLGPRPDVVLVSSFPPTAPLAAWIVAFARRADLVYWIMDLNPDQAVALKRFAPDSWPVRALNWMQRIVLARSRDVVVLDRFMAERVRAKSAAIKRLTVVPPWPLQLATAVDAVANPFRSKHGFGNRVARPFDRFRISRWRRCTSPSGRPMSTLSPWETTSLESITRRRFTMRSLPGGRFCSSVQFTVMSPTFWRRIPLAGISSTVTLQACGGSSTKSGQHRRRTFVRWDCERPRLSSAHFREPPCEKPSAIS